MSATSRLTLIPLTWLLSISAVAQSESIPANSLAIGIGYNSEDSYTFGEFTGITDRGGFAAGQFRLQSTERDDGSPSWSLEGANLGLETGRFAAEYERHGRFEFFLLGDELPHYRIDDGRTPFRGAGSTRQTLPAQWIDANSTAGFSNLPQALLPARVDKQRQRLSTGGYWQLADAWRLNGEYRHETKRGEETLGAIFGSTGGNPRGALLARPIDFETDDISVGLSYDGDTSHYNLSYNAMLFSNKDKSLNWQNPFTNPQWAAGANYQDGAFGQMALEPDSVSSGLAFSGAHRFGDGSQLNGSLTSTRLEQDDSFLPYSSALEAPTPLPRSDLGARVDLTTANLNYTRQLQRSLRLRLRYRYTDRDNKTPQALYLRIAGDSAPQAGLLSDNARRNRLYDQQSQRLTADLSYRLGGGNRLALGYEREDKDRSSVDVAQTIEDTAYLKFNFRLSGNANGWLRLGRSARDASSYDSTVPLRAGHNPDFVATLVGDEIFENDPLLRRFHLTDRDRDELSAALNFFPDSAVGISLLAKRSQDDYPGTRIGLLESTRRNVAADLSYTPAANWSASAYYNIDKYDNLQAGYARRGGGNPTPFYPAAVRLAANDWRMDSEDEVHTAGIGVDWSLLDGRLQLALDTSYADAVTMTTPASSGQNFLPLPDVSTLIKTVSLKGSYNLRSDREIRLAWFYENYQSSDWALDGVAVDTLSNVLLLGNGSPGYGGHLLLLSYVMGLH